jgi:hypothetical protein
MGMSKAKLGTGKRFKAFTSKLKSEGYSKESAGAIAASAGRKAHGSAQMAKWSAKGRVKHGK